MIEHGFVVKTMEQKNKGFVSKNAPGDSDSVALVKTNCNN